jgi:hypothetical protein
MRVLFSIFFIAISITSCKKNTQELSEDFAYIGGEIINPIESSIILESKNKIIDTIILDGRNRFKYKVEHLNAGLYTFKHGNKYQMIILEPNDSLLFRLNTFDFEESLVYTGRGARQNNFFLNEYLENEKTDAALRKFRDLKPTEFSHKLDSLKTEQIAKFKNFSKKNKVSDVFENLILQHINFSYCANKETYPFRRERSHIEEIFNALPDDFYAYRKNIDYNNSKLKDLITYKWFLKANMSNVALNHHLQHCNDNDFKRGRSLCFNLDRLKQIDSLITDKGLKEELLYYYTVKFLSLTDNPKETDTIIKNYLAKTKNEKGKKMIVNFANAVSKLSAGKSLPKLDIIDYKNNIIELSDIVNGPTVITFWSNMHYDHFKSNHYKLKDLKVKYPEVSFVSINIDNFNVKKARRLLHNNGFTNGNEYFFKLPKQASEALAIHPMTKTIIMNRNKKIVNSNSNIFHNKFEEQLLGLLNK